MGIGSANASVDAGTSSLWILEPVERTPLGTQRGWTLYALHTVAIKKKVEKKNKNW